jgi:biotin carboxylase
MKEAIIILGAGVMQGPALTIAKELGFYAIALDGSKEAPCIPLADRFEQIDLKDKEGIESFARSLQSKYDRIGIMTAGTDFSASVAWVAEKLGLPGIPYETALNASDKGRMRACFKTANLPSPDYITITTEEFSRRDAEARRTRRGLRGDSERDSNKDTKIISPFFSSSASSALSASPRESISQSSLTDPSLSFPLVIKPVDNMGSRGCRRIDRIEDFAEAAKTAIAFSRSGRAIVESYMDGPEFSVDAIVYHGEITICGLADRHIFFPPYFIEMGHTMPTIIESSKQEAMLKTFCEGVRALGLADGANIGAAKGDIKLTARGPMIGEIAARLSGGYMSGWTYPYSSGAQPIKAAILAAMGRPPEGLTPTKTWTCAERAFISIPGTVKSIHGLNEAEKLPHINKLFTRIKEGSKVSFPENNVTKCGNIIASAGDRETACKAAEKAARAVLIHLDPTDLQTADFLGQGIGNREWGVGSREQRAGIVSPPDAFKLPQSIISALNQLPDYPPSPQGDGAPIPHSPLPTPHIIPFPAFTDSAMTDYMGRTVEENLNAVRLLTGFPLPFATKNAENNNILGRSFWTALIRGAYQGAVYYLENLGKNEKEAPT